MHELEASGTNHQLAAAAGSVPGLRVGRIHPAVRAPRFDDDEITVGEGQTLDEWTLLRIGHAYQALTTHHLCVPAPPPTTNR